MYAYLHEMVSSNINKKCYNFLDPEFDTNKFDRNTFLMFNFLTLKMSIENYFVCIEEG